MSPLSLCPRLRDQRANGGGSRPACDCNDFTRSPRPDCAMTSNGCARPRISDDSSCCWSWADELKTRSIGAAPGGRPEIGAKRKAPAHLGSGRRGGCNAHRWLPVFSSLRRRSARACLVFATAPCGAPPVLARRCVWCRWSAAGGNGSGRAENSECGRRSVHRERI